MKINRKQIRSFTIENVDPTQVNASSISMSLSSEYPVQRAFGHEILMHSIDSIDMSRCMEPRGMPLMVCHDDEMLPVGRLHNVRLDPETKKLRGDASFSGRDLGQSVRQDVLDGIITDVSIGYTILDYKVNRSGSQDTPDDFVVTRWQPVECSLVGIPADPSVGMGRSDDDTIELVIPDPETVEDLVPEDSVTPEITPVAETVTPESPETADPVVTPEPEAEAVPEPPAVPDVAEAVEPPAEDQRSLSTQSDAENIIQAELLLSDATLALRTLALNLKLNTPSEIDEILRRSTNIDEARKELLNTKTRSITIIEKDTRKMPINKDTFTRSFASAIKGKYGEMDASASGLIVPSQRGFSADVFQTRADTWSGDTVASNMTSTGYGDGSIYPENIGFLDLLRARTVCFKAGAKTRAGAGSMSYWRQTVPTSVQTKPEDSGVPANSYIDGVRVPYVPHALTCTVIITDEIEMMSAFDLQEKVRQSMVLDYSLKLDNIMLNGVTAPYTINGLLSTASGIQSGNLGTAAAPTFATVNNLKALVDAYAVDLDTCSYVTNPSLMAILETTAKFTGGTGFPIADKNAINGYKALTSSNVPGGTNNTLIFGDFSNLEVALMGPTQFVVDTLTRFDEGITSIKCKQYIDVAVLQPNAFAACNNFLL
jgi:HK97 family phage major capsid protein